jgi:hypothetical protein
MAQCLRSAAIGIARRDRGAGSHTLRDFAGWFFAARRVCEITMGPSPPASVSELLERAFTPEAWKLIVLGKGVASSSLSWCLPWRWSPSPCFAAGMRASAWPFTPPSESS